MNPTVILPGATLGMIGGGQLGRMFTLEAKRMGYRVIVLEPTADSPCGQIADQQIQAAYTDRDALRQLSEACAAISYEFENIDADAIHFLENLGAVVRPGSAALRITQDRLIEKSFARNLGLAVTPFAAVNQAQDLQQALQDLGAPGFLKTTRGGYDGKGQTRIRTAEEAEASFQAVGGGKVPLIYEKQVDFVLEFSVIACRAREGHSVAFEPVENEHRNHILDLTFAPGKIPESIKTKARQAALVMGEGLGFVGTYCVEFFLTAAGEIRFNEIAPRPHNSGHFSLDAASISQFELQVRALCGLPLVEPKLLSASVMLNLVGDGKGDFLYGVPEVLALPGTCLHLYGKREAPKGRKMGHLTVLGESTETALNTLEQARQLLQWGQPPH